MKALWNTLSGLVKCYMKGDREVSADHFVSLNKVVELGSESQREIDDMKKHGFIEKDLILPVFKQVG